MSGWALFDDGPTARVDVWVDERHAGRARLALPRPDVAAGRQDSEAGFCGFELRSGLEGRAGEAKLRVLATSVGGEELEFEPLPVTIVPSTSRSPRLASPRAMPVASGMGLRLLASTNVLSLGGASLYLCELLIEAHRQGRLDPVVISPIDGPVRPRLEAAGIEVHLLGPLPLDDVDAYLDRIEELVAWAGGRKFELVLVNTASGLALPGADLARRLGLPAVWSIHESFPAALRWEEMDPALVAHAEGLLAEASFAVFQAEATRSLYDRPPRERSQSIPYGLDLEPVEAVRVDFDRAAERGAEGIPAEAELIICVGTVEPRKAQVPLIGAFDLIASRHPRAELAFVGADPGPQTAALEQRLEASPHRERIRIFPRTPAVQRWFGMADLLVCASDVESLPKTVVEAMAWETPVLATSVFGLPELIDHGVNGWLCEPGDLGALAAGIDAALATDPSTRAAIGTAGRQQILHRHDFGDYARRISDLLESV